MSAEEIFQLAKTRDLLTLNVFESKEVLRLHGIPVNKYALAKDTAEAIDIAKEIGFPVALKLVSHDLTHKTEIGGVVLGLNTEEEIKNACDNMLQNAKKLHPEADIAGILVENMIKPDNELIVGAVSDPVFGHLLAFGFGGIFVEVYEDVAWRIVPITKNDALDMMKELTGFKILTGYRGRKPVDLDSLAELLVSVSNMVRDHPEINEMDINPLFSSGSEHIAVDARFILKG